MTAHELHRRAAVVDCHNDLPAQLLMWNRSLGEQGDRDYFRTGWLRDAERGGVDLQVMPVWTPSSLGESSLRETLVMLAALTREIEANRDRVSLCTTAADIDAALEGRRLGALLALEGAAIVGSDLELLETLQRLGVRMISFTHWHRNVFAEGSGDDSAGGGLTDLGRTALADIEALGMLFDVSHLGRRSVDDVLSAATRPVLASHSCARALCDHHRNLSDEALRGIAESGGIVGVAAIPEFVDARRPTLERFCDHVEHVAAVVGRDRVALGCDFITELYGAMYPQFERFMVNGSDLRQGLVGLESTGDLPHVTVELLKRGWSEDDLRNLLGESALRLFRQLLTPAARGDRTRD